MKVEIDVELPECIAEKWEVVAVRRAEVDEVIAVPHCDAMVAMRTAVKTTFPEIILRRKHNPCEWWPQWVKADRITFTSHGAIGFHEDNGTSGYWSDTSSLLDFSWIPEYLRRSGITIQNPWKGGE